jgi:hypothetical protein
MAWLAAGYSIMAQLWQLKTGGSETRGVKKISKHGGSG